MKKLEFHPISAAYDLLEGKPFDDLVTDIKAFGVREKIVLFDGRILDGRNRYLAARKAGIKDDLPVRTFKGTEEGAIALVESVNAHRRHLTDGARAMAAARIAKLRDGMRADRQGASRDAPTQAAAAEKQGVSRSSVQRARKIEDQGSKELQRAVSRGEVPIKTAAAVVNLPKSEQLAAAIDKPKNPKADLSEFVDAEEADRGTDEYDARIKRVLEGDDKLLQMSKELERASKEIVALKQARDRYMNESAEKERRINALNREVARLEKQLSAKAA